MDDPKKNGSKDENEEINFEDRDRDLDDYQTMGEDSGNLKKG